MRSNTPKRLCSVAEVATMLGITPRTVRRWLDAGLLSGKKIGTTWVVLLPQDCLLHGVLPARRLVPTEKPPGPRLIRQHLRQLGQRLITVANAAAGVQQQRGAVFVTWRRPGGLQLTFAIGRTSPIQGWAPHAVGLALPFWLRERQRWHGVSPLLRRYERLRHWCHPRLLRLPAVQELVEAELRQLSAAMESFAPQEFGTDGRSRRSTQRA